MNFSRILLALGLAMSSSDGLAQDPAGWQSNPSHLNWWRANRIVGTWEFQVHLFTCDTQQTLARFRAASVYNIGGTMLDTNTAPPTSRGPAFGVWTYNRYTREYLTQFRLYRYNPDGSFAGVNEVHGTATLSGDGNRLTGQTRGRILGPNEELLAESCGTNEGTRSL